VKGIQETDKQTEREEKNNVQGRRGLEKDKRWGETEVDNDVKQNGVAPLNIMMIMEGKTITPLSNEVTTETMTATAYCIRFELTNIFFFGACYNEKRHAIFTSPDGRLYSAHSQHRSQPSLPVPCSKNFSSGSGSRSTPTVP
jgi:hypothetical protein